MVEARVALVLSILAVIFTGLSVYITFIMTPPVIVMPNDAPDTAVLERPSNAEQAETCSSVLMASNDGAGLAGLEKQQLIRTAWENAGCPEYYKSIGGQ